MSMFRSDSGLRWVVCEVGDDGKADSKRPMVFTNEKDAFRQAQRIFSCGRGCFMEVSNAEEIGY